jgi:hypothetical protein
MDVHTCEKMAENGGFWVGLGEEVVFGTVFPARLRTYLPFVILPL